MCPIDSGGAQQRQCIRARFDGVDHREGQVVGVGGERLRRPLAVLLAVTRFGGAGR